MVIEMGGATYGWGMHLCINVRTNSEDIVMTIKVKANDIDKLLNEIDILTKDKAKYKKLWKKAENNYDYMFEVNSKNEDKIEEQEDMLHLIINYCIFQRKLYRSNHYQCIKQAIDKIPHDKLLDISKAFEARLKAQCSDEKEFNEVMKHIDSSEPFKLETIIKG